MQQSAFNKNASRRRLHAPFSIQLLRMMKLTVLLLTVICLHVTAGTSAQGISLKLVDADLKRVFTELKRQTTFQFIYNNEQLKQAKKVTITVTNADFREVLAMVFKDQPLYFAIEEGKYVVIKPKPVVAAEPVDTTIAQIRGRVVTDKGEPIPGATISVKGTNKATATDNNGVFVLNQVSSEAVVVISGTNIETRERKLNDSGDLNIIAQLRSVEGEEIIINTGYQKMNPNEITGSVSVINNGLLNQQVGAGIIERLDGVASGVLFPKQDLQDGPGFMVRGFSTINGPKAPLVVIDNFPYEGDINNINPNDVESISILKDAAAASIWGARAGNGVVVITTKKGKLNQPLRINVNTNVSIIEKPQLSKLNTISSADYIDVEKMLFDKEFYYWTINDTWSRQAVTPVVEILNKESLGYLTKEEVEGQLNKYRGIDFRDQYNKHIYKQGFAQQYAINLSGGSGNIAYYLSAGYDRNNDNLSNNNDRFTFRSDNLYKPFKNLQITIGLQYSHGTSKAGKPGLGIRYGSWQAPYLELADPNGIARPVATSYLQSYIDTAGAGKLLDWNYYPLEDWKHNIRKTSVQDFQANLGLNYEIVKGMSVDIKYMHERQSTDRENLQNLQSYDTRTLINLFTQVDHNSGAIKHVLPVGGMLNISQATLRSHNLRGQINYNISLNDHNITALIGSELRQNHTKGLDDRIYGYNDENIIATNVDLVNPYPTYINGGYNYIPGGIRFTDRLNRFVSFYANAAYTYKGKYSLYGSGRRDASNLFGVNTNNKWTPLWSSGISWDIRKERFFNLKFLSILKMRGSYGFSGNTDLSRGGQTVLIYTGQQLPGIYPTARVEQFANPELRWEKVKTINLGIDFSTAKKVINGSIDFYIKKGIDLLGPSPVDPTTGLNGNSSITKNVAKMKGRGIDVMVNRNILNRLVKWNLMLNFNYSRNKVVEYYHDSNITSFGIVSTGYTINPIQGRDMYTIAGFKWGGLDVTGDPQGFFNGEKSKSYSEVVRQSPIDQLIYQPSIPVYFGNLISTVYYKGFTLSINISYKMGYSFVRQSLQYASLFENGAINGTGDYNLRWQKAGDELKTNVPAMVHPNSPDRDLFYKYADVQFRKGNHIRLQYINIGYDFKSLVKSLSGMQFYINASNLGILWKKVKDVADPNYPANVIPSRMFTIGMRINLNN